MTPPPTRTPAERFAGIIDTLCSTIAAHAGRHHAAAPVVVLLWGWLRRSAGRFARLAAQVAAGKLPPARRRPAASRPPRDRTVRPPTVRKPCLPGGFAWVVRLVPGAAPSGSQLRYWLADPEVAALIAAAPSIGRLLRPLCRMLGVRPPPALKLPPRQPAARPARRAAAPRPPDLPAPTPRPRPKRGPLVIPPGHSSKTAA